MFQQAHGFMWPEQAVSDCKRYVDSAAHLEKSIGHCASKTIAVQAGGHCGTWPKYLAGRFEHVYTFEPYWLNFLALNRNVEEQNVFRFQAALGDGWTPVYLVPHPGNIGGNHITEREGKGIMVPQMTIDNLGLLACDLIVLDVEGSELQALLGARQTIQKYHPVLHLEMKGRIEKYARGLTSHLKAFLSSYGYKQVGEVGHDIIYKSTRST
jgi:FkbM family methyltransferase